jgi:hypothetical protein
VRLADADAANAAKETTVDFNHWRTIEAANSSHAATMKAAVNNYRAAESVADNDATRRSVRTRNSEQHRGQHQQGQNKILHRTNLSKNSGKF